ncbi:hypothetical protein FNJ62_04335 [Streptomyces benahoarensis]|uniref:Uncharacterized protein n=1 Tax=Streptomyces benahoarensis TaxID=2595054 RepID=A0A553ZQR7_9ACTN|nr:hypothetical protein [Streptomyces benahoarensis]TSB31817.1 hypothetical protein FNJ62_04335 [Streptomyces benahoarensis]TSB43763.1 hypothetical protein FNZ23_02785 [Streptomyces benahoarensis]
MGPDRPERPVGGGASGWDQGPAGGQGAVEGVHGGGMHRWREFVEAVQQRMRPVSSSAWARSPRVSLVVAVAEARRPGWERRS